MTPAQNISYFKEALETDKPVKIIIGALCALVFTALIYISTKGVAGLVIAGAVSALPLIILSVRSPKFWLYTVAATSVLYFKSEEGVSAIDVFCGAYYIGGLAVWFIWSVAVKRKRVIRNAADWAVILFFMLLPFNLIIELLNGGEFLDWFRQYSLFLFILFYFPIREHFADRKSLTRLLIIYALVVLAIDGGQFYTYYKAAFTDLVYAYQLGSSVRNNQALFTSASVFGLLFALNQKKKLYKALLLIFSTLTILALITSFSRMFWLALLLDFIILFIYLPKAKKLILLTSTIIIVGFFSLAAVIIFKDKVDLIVKIIEKRLLSSAKGTSDVSIQMRFSEYEAALKQIYAHPLGGNGLAKKFRYYDKFNLRAVEKMLIHNGYLFMAYKMGIPMAALYFLPFLLYLIKAERFARKCKEPFYKALAIGSMAALLLSFLSSLVTSIHLMRDGSFVICLSIVFISIIAEKMKDDPVGDNIHRKD